MGGLLPGTAPEGEHTFTVPVTMQLHSWWTHGRAAKDPGVSLGQPPREVLRGQVTTFEDCGFRTEWQWEAYRKAKLKERPSRGGAEKGG